MVVSFYIGGIIDNFLIKFTKNGNARGVKLALSLYSIKNTFEKFFSKVNPFRDKNVSGDQTLTKALEYAVTNLDHNVMKLLISAGADVNEIEKNSIDNVIHQHTIASEAMLYGDKDSLKNHKEKCCLVLGELITNGAIPQNAKDRNKILEIFRQTEGFDELKEVVKLKFKPQKPPRISKCNDALLSKEPIYAEVYDGKISNSLEELSISDYAEIYDSQKGSTKNLSLEDSGYSSISEEPTYEDIDHFSEQKKSANLNNKEQSEPIYAQVDLFKKRAERKIKDIKANSGTYHGLVQDKVKKWQAQMGQSSDECVNLQQTNNQTIEIKADFSVKEIRQKFECRDSGHDSGYDSDTKVERQLELAPKSEIGSVSIEHGVIGGCRYKITDISL